MATNKTMTLGDGTNTTVGFNVNGTIKQNNTQVSLEGHTHKDDILVITEDMVTVEIDETKGIAPYNTSYGYTGITVDIDYEPKIGSIIYPVINTKMVVASANRNVRIRFGESGRWIPLFGTSSILTGSSFFTKGQNRIYLYKTTYQSTGAFHMLQDDNSTYAYLMNDFAANTYYVATNGYVASDALSFYTEPIGSSTQKFSSFCSSRSTGSSKTYNNIDKYYIHTPPILFAGSYASDALIAATGYKNYDNGDIRYTANVSSTYIKAGERIYLYLKNFDPTDMSFECSKDNKVIVSQSQLDTAYGNLTSPIYLYCLGETTVTWYSRVDAFIKGLLAIYTYDPTTKELKQWVRDRLLTIPTSGGGGGITAETDPVFTASVAHGITQTDINNWNGKTSNTGTVTSVNNVSPVNGNVTLSIPTYSSMTQSESENGTSTEARVISPKILAYAIESRIEEFAEEIDEVIGSIENGLSKL